MKKHCLFLITVLALLFPAALALANYPAHLNGDTDYILVDGHMGTAWYLDRSSVQVVKEEPPVYVLTVQVATARSAIDDVNDFYENGGSGIITEVRSKSFLYNTDALCMYYSSTGHDGWTYLKPLGSWAQTGVNMPTGEMAFYLAYGEKFYGRQQWSENGQKYYAAFSDKFYQQAE